MDITRQYDVICKASFDSILRNFALHLSSEADWDEYVRIEHPFRGYNFATGEVSRFPPSRVARPQRSRSEVLVPFEDLDIVRFPGLV